VSIEAAGASAAKLQYVSSVDTRRGGLRQSWLSNEDFLGAGTIHVRLSDRPTSWATNSAPPPLVRS
jgi:putative alpha-1,2-mannosidase